MKTLVTTIFSCLGAMASINAMSADPDCPRYVDMMKNPAAVAALEAWRARLPATFDKTKYPRVLESSDFGAYSIALDFDPAVLNLGSTAHAEISIDPNNKKIRFAAISDTLRTGFVFRFEGYEYMFEGFAMKSPRSGHVGVACAAARGDDD